MRQRLRKVSHLASCGGVVLLGQQAHVVAQRQQALEQLATVVQLPGGPDYGRLKFDPVWDGIRKEPKFQEIMARASQPPSWN